MHLFWVSSATIASYIFTKISILYGPFVLLRLGRKIKNIINKDCNKKQFIGHHSTFYLFNKVLLFLSFSWINNFTLQIHNKSDLSLKLPETSKLRLKLLQNNPILKFLTKNASQFLGKKNFRQHCSIKNESVKICFAWIFVGKSFLHLTKISSHFAEEVCYQ